MTQPGDDASDVVRLTRINRTLLIELHRPDCHNAFNMRMLDAVDGALRLAGDSDDVKSVVLTGAGKAFSSGDDIRGVGFPDRPDPSLDEELYRGHWRVIRTMRSLAKPVIAALHGWALGGGSDLALAADLRVADPTLQLGAPYMKRGFTGGIAVLAGLVGLSVASDMILTGRYLGTEEAIARGLVHRSAPEGKAVEVALSLAEELDSVSWMAVSLTKRVLSEHWRRRVDDFVIFDNYTAMVVGSSSEQHEGLAAFLEKRRPSFNHIDQPR